MPHRRKAHFPPDRPDNTYYNSHSTGAVCDYISPTSDLNAWEIAAKIEAKIYNRKFKRLLDAEVAERAKRRAKRNITLPKLKFME